MRAYSSDARRAVNDRPSRRAPGTPLCATTIGSDRDAGDDVAGNMPIVGGVAVYRPRQDDADMVAVQCRRLDLGRHTVDCDGRIYRLVDLADRHLESPRSFLPAPYAS